MSYKSFIATISLALSLTFSSLTPTWAETETVKCPNGGSYQILFPAGAAVDGKDCGGDLKIDPRVKILAKEVFRDSGLTSVSIPDSVSLIEDGAFLYAGQLNTVVIGKSVKKIGALAFMETKIRRLVLPEGLETIGLGAFSWTPLRNIYLGSSLKSALGAFSNTEIEVLVFPKTLETLECGALSDMVRLTSVSLPRGFRISDEGFCGKNAAFLFNEKNYSLSKISYCGSISTFPIKPVCVSATDDFLDVSNRELLTNIQSLIDSEKAEAEARAKAEADARAKAEAAKKRVTITCIKGKITKRVTAVNPKCPAGYKKK